MADADRDGALVGHHVAAGEHAGAAGHHPLVDLHDAVGDLQPGDAVEQREVGLLAEREHDRVGLELLELAGRLREAALVELHPLDHDPALAGALDRREPLDEDALLERLLELEVVRGHPLARAAVDDDGLLGAEPLRGPRDVHGRVAAAVDDDAAAEPRRLLALHRAQHRDGVEHARRAARRDVGAAADVRADGEERGVEPAVAHLGPQVGHGAVALERRRRGRGSAAISASRISRGSR